MGSEMDQERPWKREEKPMETLRQRTARANATVQQDECCGRSIHDGDPEGYVLACCGRTANVATGGAE